MLDRGRTAFRRKLGQPVRESILTARVIGLPPGRDQPERELPAPALDVFFHYVGIVPDGGRLQLPMPAPFLTSGLNPSFPGPWASQTA